MRTKREPAGEPNANQGATKGVRLLHRQGRPNPYGVQWSEQENGNRKVKTQFFPTEEARDNRAAGLARDRKKGVTQTPTRDELADWRAFKTMIGSVPWRDVVAGYNAHRLGRGDTDSKFTVAQWVEDYLGRLKVRADAGEVVANTYRHHRHKLRLFAHHFGHQPLNRVLTEDIVTWLDGIRMTRGKAKGKALKNAGTFNNYRKIVAVLFEDALLARHVTENPVSRIRQRKIIGDEVGILTVPEIARLFHYAMIYDRFKVCVRRLALETFAGVRFSSACRLTNADINMEDRGIRHTARSIKTQKRQYVEGFPDNLWEWLKVAPDDSGLTERQYVELKSRLFDKAFDEWDHPRNCLRHSFPTYHLAARQSPGLTAYLLCHRNQQKLWDHYKGNATKAEGERFERITPQTAAEIAKEWVARDRLGAGAPAPSPGPLGSVPAPAGGSDTEGLRP